MNNGVHHKVTQRLMYGFSVILSRYGATERKAEMVAAKVGSNLKSMQFAWVGGNITC